MAFGGYDICKQKIEILWIYKLELRQPLVEIYCDRWLLPSSVKTWKQQ